MQIMLRCILQVTLKSQKNLPWLNKTLVQAIRRRNALFRAAKKCKSTASFQKYRAVRNKVVALLRLNKTKFFKKLANASQKEFWKAIKLLNKQESCIPTLNQNGKTVESNGDKALLLNTFFYNCFNKAIPPLISHQSLLDPTGFPQHFLCTEDCILDMIEHMDMTKSTGSDEISARMLKETAPAIAPGLTRLFNLSLTTGCFPDDCKLARVVPVPKSSDYSSPSTYRPISILSILSKGTCCKRL